MDGWIKNGCAINFIKKRFQTSYNINGIKVTSVFFDSKTDFLIKIFVDRVNRCYFVAANTIQYFNKIMVITEDFSVRSGRHGRKFGEIFLT